MAAPETSTNVHASGAVLTTSRGALIQFTFVDILGTNVIGNITFVGWVSTPPSSKFLKIIMKAESNSPPGAAKASDGLSLLAAAVEHERFAPHCLFTANDFNHDDDKNRKRLFYSSGSVLAPAPSNGMDVATAKSNAFSYLNGLLPFPRASLLINGSTMTSLAPHFLPKMVEGEQMIRHSTMKPNETLLKIHINSNQSRSPDSTEFSDSQAIVQPISNSNIDSTIHQISSQGNDKSCSSSNSKQYLRYKLLERQNRLNTSSSSQIAVNEKIVAVGVKSRDERSSKVGAFKSGRFSAFTPCSSTGGGGTLSVKECLSTLSINVVVFHDSETILVY
uniref:Uncharacterized protein n=1 Tax=Romanomermis culicivorax TaxID=13658 RepID=A0A915JHN1_ROMCU